MAATTFVLIPGAGGTAWVFHRLEPELRRLGHETVAVDLPAGDDEAGLADYVDAVLKAAAGRDNPVVVGQSMGGLSAPIVAASLPATQLVLLNAMIPMPGETGGDWWANTGQAEAKRELDLREGRDPDTAFDPLVTFFHDVPAEVTAAAMASGAPDQSGRPFEDPWPLATWPDVPTRVLAARDDRLFPVDFQIRVSRERLGRTPEVIPGGHLVALSRPAELAATLHSGLPRSTAADAGR
jgi:pimeloyl-ACP methyl ester carboxylesterase